MNSYKWMMATKQAAQRMPQYLQELCQLDTEIGDGDHGITISRGYQSVQENVELNENTAVESFCLQLGTVLSANMGGAIGPVYGVFWKAFSKLLAGKTEIDAPAIADAFLAAAQKIADVCKVSQGDKTVFDALLPAAQEFDRQRGSTLQEAMQAAEAATSAGCESTRHMLARKGRARFLSERSLDHIDAGAFSFYRWMQEWNNAINERP